jgi:predicted phage terminase large subunit-like protein
MNRPPTDLTPAQYWALLRQDLCTFIERSFRHLNHTRFLPNWHIEVLAAKLEACRRGEIRRLIINIPPRHLKSLGASVAFPAWCLGHNPAAQILAVSYAQDLADKHARDCRAIMTSRWYRKLFPAVQLSPSKQAVQEFVTTVEGYRLATSVGGVLTGRGADIIIIDDPLKPEEALSEAQRRAVNEWYDNTLYSRLNDKEHGCIILIMQRLHEDDLVGHVLAQEPWEVLSFPAIAEHDEEYRIDTALGPHRFTRRAAEALHPERESLDTLARIRATVGEYNFAGQYQQAPAPLGGGLVKAEWFPTYQPHELPKSFDQVVQSWDTANKPTELSDFSVCTTWGLLDRRLYLLDVLRKRMDYPQLKRKVREHAEAWHATVVLIEDRASGIQLIQELRAANLHVVIPYEPQGDKVMCMHAQTATMENGSVYLPSAAAWLPEYLHELTIFPNARYDDQADSTSQALAWIRAHLARPPSSEYYRCLHLQGLTQPEIAAKLGVPLAELQLQLKSEQQQKNRLIETYVRARPNPRFRCHRRIPFGPRYQQEGDRCYHLTCWDLAQRGQ